MNQPTFNLFSTNIRLVYPLKTSENRKFSDVFREYRSGTLVENGLKTSVKCFLSYCKVTWKFCRLPMTSNDFIVQSFFKTFWLLYSLNKLLTTLCFDFKTFSWYFASDILYIDGTLTKDIFLRMFYKIQERLPIVMLVSKSVAMVHDFRD